MLLTQTARFCILEQYLPQGPDHPFAKTMLAHFKKLQASIYAIERYLTLEQQSTRFLQCGWTTLNLARNLWDLWSDDVFTPPALRRKVEAIEPFDEWEEFALFGGHYSLLVASNTKLKDSTETTRVNAVAVDIDSQSTHADTSSLITCQDTPGVQLTPRRFTAAFLAGNDCLAIHGGQGSQSRLADLDVLRRDDQQSGIQPCDSLAPSARMCHTITSVREGEALLVGGRGSPMQALQDCWLMKGGIWTQVDNLLVARYRHSATALRIEEGVSQVDQVLVFGGKTSDGTVLDDWTLWSANGGWRNVPVEGPEPSARFGAAMSTIGSAYASGLLIGGVGVSGTVLDDVWEWSLSATPTLRLTFKERTNNICSNTSTAAYARIGASLVPWTDDSLLLIGGVPKDGIHSLSEEFLLLTPSDSRVDICYPPMQVPSSWPLLIGMGVVAVSRSEVIIAGGGAVCFSMGSFWNEGYFSVTKSGTQGAKKPWHALPRQVSGTGAEPTMLDGPCKRATKKKSPAHLPRNSKVSVVELQSAEEFAELIATSKPAIIKGQNIGPCTGLWTLEYLRDKIGPERELIVHKCSTDRMTFKEKNFSYVKKTATQFLDDIANGSQEYLRAISSSQPNKLPTKLDEDFPTISDDFQLPEIFEVVKENCHSSPLRVSGPVSLWLHYDVLANILCQVTGTKTLYLYPPSDVKYLDYPPGGSSSNTDVLNSKDPKLRYTHPHVAFLKPGDILFIPPMWSHTATPEEGVSIAVNVFWRNLDKGYAAGKDVYGNRDLQAYENGRRDVEKILKAFREVPPDIARFYLDRLAGEIQDKANNLSRKSEEDNKKTSEQS